MAWQSKSPGRLTRPRCQLRRRSWPLLRGSWACVSQITPPDTYAQGASRPARLRRALRGWESSIPGPARGRSARTTRGRTATSMRSVKAVAASSRVAYASARLQARNPRGISGRRRPSWPVVARTAPRTRGQPSAPSPRPGRRRAAATDVERESAPSSSTRTSSGVTVTAAAFTTTEVGGLAANDDRRGTDLARRRRGTEPRVRVASRFGGATASAVGAACCASLYYGAPRSN